MKHRGVVVEIAPKKRVIVMTAQGEFIKVPFRKHVHVGQEIRYSPKKERLNVWQLGLAATLFLTLLGTWPLFTNHLLPVSAIPAFIITLDINPSLELKVSAKHRILEVEGLNQEGKELAENLAVTGVDLKEALERITLLAQQRGFFRQGQNRVVVTIASKEERDATVTELKTLRSGDHGAIEQIVHDAFRATQLTQVQIWQVPWSLQQEAKLAGITPSRYIAIQLPSQRVIPQRLETKLTMKDGPLEIEESKSTDLVGTLHANAPPVPPVLTPAQWTRQGVGARTAEAYNVSFPLATQAKGEFQLYQ